MGLEGRGFKRVALAPVGGATQGSEDERADLKATGWLWAGRNASGTNQPATAGGAYT